MATNIEERSSSKKFSWTIKKLSTLADRTPTYSDVFSVGGFKWKTAIYPNGNVDAYNQYLSLFLYPVDLKTRVETKFSFEVNNQFDPSYYGVKEELTKEFPDKDFCSWGCPKFMLLDELKDPEYGYIVNDTCMITVKVTCTTDKESKDHADVEENTNEVTCMTNKESEDGNDSDWDDVTEKYSKMVVSVLEEESEVGEDHVVNNWDDTIEDDSNNKDAKTENGDQIIEKDVKSTSKVEYPGAGQPFGEGTPNNVGEDKEFEDVGGFSILRAQAPLYWKIWLKYGHIPSTKVMPIVSYNSYPILVMVVKDLMSSITDMHESHYVDLTSEMMERWESVIKMAEKLEFNIEWLRERFETMKKGMCGMQNARTELLEHGQSLRAAQQKLKYITDVMKRFEVQVTEAKGRVRENTCGLLSESDMEMYLEIGENLVLDGLF